MSAALRVLVIEDSATLRGYLVDALEAQGFKVVGTAAVSRCAKVCARM